MERDREVDQALRARDWKVLRFWDVEINKQLEECVEAVWDAVNERKMEQYSALDDEF